MINLNLPLERAISALFRTHAEALGIPPENAQVYYSNKGAQFQCNGALASARALKRAPRQIAEQWIAEITAAEPETFSLLEVAGPGFININISDMVLEQKVAQIQSDERFGVPRVESPERVYIDFGGYNVAKQLHIGHLRSTIIGETLRRTLTFMGDEVIGDVHLGDWGTQMGMLIEAVRELSPNLPYFHADPTTSPIDGYPEGSPITLNDMNRLYPEASARCKSDPDVRRRASEATALLQSGHLGYRALWRHFVALSVAEVKRDIAPFDVHFDLWLGESDAQPIISELVTQLTEEGHAELSEGALIVRLYDERGEEMVPLMLRKSDGGATYHTSDLATLMARIKEGADRVLYVVDARQEMHFKQVFQAAYQTNLARPELRLEHVKFGTINGADGRPFKTRSGDTVKLRDVVNLAIEAAATRSSEQSEETESDASAPKSEISESAELDERAQAIAVAAIKFGDLSNHRTSDYILKLEDFCAFEGKTGPYLLYACVRIQSIFAKARAQGLTPSEIIITNDEDRALAFELTRLPLVLTSVHEKLTPHVLCEYLFGLSQRFSVFYQRCNIIRQPDPKIQGSWLSLITLCRETILLGLDLLGLESPERM